MTTFMFIRSARFNHRKDMRAYADDKFRESPPDTHL